MQNERVFMPKILGRLWKGVHTRLRTRARYCTALLSVPDSLESPSEDSCDWPQTGCTNQLVLLQWNAQGNQIPKGKCLVSVWRDG